MKRQLILLVVVIALIAVVLVQRRQQQEFVASEPVASVSLEPGRVSRLQIQRPGEPLVEFERVGGGWHMRQPFDYQAQEQAVQSLLTVLEDLELQDVVSSNPDNQGLFEVDSTGTLVQAWDGDKQVMDLVVGKATPDYAHTYVRREGQDEVYRAVGMLTYNFNKKPDDWRDKTILNVNRDDIRRVELRYPKDDVDVVLARQDSVWTVSVDGKDAAPADSMTVATLLGAASHLNTVSFAAESDQEKIDFEHPDFTLFLGTDAGQHEVDFWKGEANRWLARLAGRDDVTFSLFESNLNRIRKKAEDFQPASS
jgi:hypothetical protein